MMIYLKAFPSVWSSFVNSKDAAVSDDPGSCTNMGSQPCTQGNIIRSVWPYNANALLVEGDVSRVRVFFFFDGEIGHGIDHGHINLRRYLCRGHIFGWCWGRDNSGQEL